MMSLEEGLYLRIDEITGGPQPLPLRSGFSANTAYRVLGAYTPSDTAEAYFMLSNDRDEIWFISNQHLRTVGINRMSVLLRMPVSVSVGGRWEDN